MILEERIASQPEVIRATAPEHSPCCGMWDPCGCGQHGVTCCHHAERLGLRGLRAEAFVGRGDASREAELFLKRCEMCHVSVCCVRMCVLVCVLCVCVCVCACVWCVCACVCVWGSGLSRLLDGATPAWKRSCGRRLKGSQLRVCVCSCTVCMCACVLVGHRLAVHLHVEEHARVGRPQRLLRRLRLLDLCEPGGLRGRNPKSGSHQPMQNTQAGVS